jgi:hypothetical protein
LEPGPGRAWRGLTIILTFYQQQIKNKHICS